MGGAKFKGAGLPSRCDGLAQYDSDDFAHWGRSGVLERIVVNDHTTAGIVAVYDAEKSAGGTAAVTFALGLDSGSVIECGLVMNTALTVDLAGDDDVIVVYNANRD